VSEFKAEVLLHERRAAGGDDGKNRVAHEIGDILFTVVNVARRMGIDPEAALQSTNARFRRRFEEVARKVAAAGGDVTKTPLVELDRLWDEAKAGGA